ncbi:hypothetical protein [Streptomyces sp. NPDC054787]
MAEVRAQLQLRQRKTLQSAADEDLPALFHERGTSRLERQKTAHYVRALQTWLAGSYDWCESTARYGAANSGWKLPTGPTGLGTSAARCLHNRSPRRGMPATSLPGARW